jgi:hypothetical protein
MTHTRARLPLPTESLAAEHREILNLLHDLEELPTEVRDRREAIVHQVERRLLSHLILEEEVIYPAVWRTGRDRAIERIEEARWGHRILRQILSDLVAADPGGDGFSSLVQLLREDLEEYSRIEEENLFAELRMMGPGTLRMLRDRLEERREQLGHD